MTIHPPVSVTSRTRLQLPTGGTALDRLSQQSRSRSRIGFRTGKWREIFAPLPSSTTVGGIAVNALVVLGNDSSTCEHQLTAFVIEYLHLSCCLCYARAIRLAGYNHQLLLHDHRLRTIHSYANIPSSYLTLTFVEILHPVVLKPFCSLAAYDYVSSDDVWGVHYGTVMTVSWALAGNRNGYLTLHDGTPINKEPDDVLPIGEYCTF